MEQLLADRAWWDRWLPRLNELVGGEMPKGYGAALHAPRDGRGYLDVMAALLPPFGKVTWRSPGYPAAAEAEVNTRSSRPEPPGAGPWPDPRTIAGVVWAPVIRHVAEALCALESTASDGTDAYLRLRAEAEIIGSWSTVLDRLLMAKG